MFCRVQFVFSFQLLFSSTYIPFTEVESSRTHFEVLLPRSFKFSKISVLGSRRAVFLESLKLCRSFFVEKFVFLEIFWFCSFENTWKKFLKTFFLKRVKKNFEDIIIIIFGQHLRLCPCPRKGLSSKGLSLASDIFLCPWPQALCPQLHLCPVSV